MSYVRLLTICLLSVYFVGAAGCHCFEIYKKVFSLKKLLSYNFLLYRSLHYNEPWSGLVDVSY